MQEYLFGFIKSKNSFGDAYLSATGHLRPGIARRATLLLEAKKKRLALENQILTLLSLEITRSSFFQAIEF